MSAETPAQSNRPLVIGRYKVVKRIGSGGMGTVYKAVHLDLGREAALKVLPPDLASKPEMLERFALEAKHAARLRHENIVTLYEYSEANGTRFLAMEFVEGTNLHEYINEKGRVEPEEARQLILQAARALALAHKSNIVHRDIKPSNFLLTQKDGKAVVKLTDFGLARGLDDTDFKVTKTGTTVGTVDYIAPEQARNSRSADIRSDIYSLGCTLYHMLTGQPPFPEGDLTERLLKHVEAVPEDVRRFNRDVPAGLVVVLERMLAKKPGDRYQTPRELIKDLEQLPSGFALDPRALMQALAEEVGGKPKPARRAAPETQHTAAVGSTQIGIPAMPGVIPKLHYRNSPLGAKPRKRARWQGFQPWIVISGWKVWAALGLAGGVVTLLILALTLGWGARQEKQPPLQAAAPDGSPERTKPGTKKANEEITHPPEERETTAKVQTISRPLEPTPPRQGSPRIQVPDQLVQEVQREYQPREASAIAEQTRQSPQDYQQYFRTGQVLERGITSKPSNPAESVGSRVLTGPEPGKTTGSEQTVPPAATRERPSPTTGSTPKTASGPQPSAAGPPIYVVSRAPSLAGERQANSLASACALATADKGTETVIVEIRDNGPLFETPMVVTGRNLVLRAAKGYRPLLCWDLGAKAGAKLTHLVSVSQGGLVLENLDFVLKGPDDRSMEMAGLIRVQGGHLLAEGCTFSITGRHAQGLAAVQLDGTRPDGKPAVARMNGCYFRGAEMKLLDLKSSAAEVELDTCLAVGSNRPLLDVHAAGGLGPIKVRVVRSTLVAGVSFLRVRATGHDASSANVSWLGWDTILARHGGQPGGEMVDLQEGFPPSALKWRAVNCLYTGWPTLLKWQGGTVAAQDQEGWQKLWEQAQGDAVKEPTWPALLPADPSEVPPEAFRVVGTHAEFSALAGQGTLGCNVSLLPSGRDKWLALTYERLVPPPYYPAPVDQAPENPASTEEAYYGERLDLTEVNLGEHLAKVQSMQRLGRKLVLRLTGKGEARTGPIHLQNVNLVLYFEPATSEKDRLVLVPTNTAGAEALIDIDGGSLEIIGGKIRFPNQRSGSVPDYLLKVHGGDLRLSGCRLEGPLEQAPRSFRGLIHFQSAENDRSEQGQGCALANCVLLSGKECIDARGAGARLRLQNCVVVAGSDAIRVASGTPAWGQRPTCILEHNSVAARRAVLHLGDLSAPPPRIEPLVVQARANVFLAPFGEDHHAGALLYEGEALPHGLVLWQGEANFYDPQLHYFVSADRAPEMKQKFVVWERLWGSAGERPPERLLSIPKPEPRTLDLDRPLLSRLEVQSLLPRETGTPPGADLEQLGLIKSRRPK
jgi:serine/threonine-protein kinase